METWSRDTLENAEYDWEEAMMKRLQEEGNSDPKALRRRGGWGWQTYAYFSLVFFIFFWVADLSTGGVVSLVAPPRLKNQVAPHGSSVVLVAPPDSSQTGGNDLGPQMKQAPSVLLRGSLAFHNISCPASTSFLAANPPQKTTFASDSASRAPEQYYEELFGFSEASILGPLKEPKATTDELNEEIRQKFALSALTVNSENVGEFKLDVLTPKEGGRKKRLIVGRFSTPTPAELETQAKEKIERSNMLKNVMSSSTAERSKYFDVKDLFSADGYAFDTGKIVEEHPLATFQGAGQLNGLQQTDSKNIPHGIVNYFMDERQGAALAITGFAGTLWRNHFVEFADPAGLTTNTNRGQTDTPHQLNFFADVWKGFTSSTSTPGKPVPMPVLNGYLLPRKASDTVADDQWESDSERLDLEELFYTRMQVGLQQDTEFTGRRDPDPLKKNHAYAATQPGLAAGFENGVTADAPVLPVITHVYSAGIYYPNEVDLVSDPGMGRGRFYYNFLSAQYLGAFAAALNTAIRWNYQEDSNKLFLTALGADARVIPEGSDEDLRLREMLANIVGEHLAVYRNCGLEIVLVAGFSKEEKHDPLHTPEGFKEAVLARFDNVVKGGNRANKFTKKKADPASICDANGRDAAPVAAANPDPLSAEVAPPQIGKAPGEGGDPVELASGANAPALVEERKFCC
ncbi:unnamed protein product [Amoebophrya sp. A25]|nr:unnamed protein product [Amoebophrya sp. A25]|eukprot:GSA25T00019752001.1